MKTRTVKRCEHCGCEFLQAANVKFENGMFARCPHCYGYLRTAARCYAKFVRQEQWYSESVWYMPWTWHKGRWVANADIAELERLVRL